MPGLHTTTRIPVDDEYAANLGKAVYAFAYYEWTIIWIIERIAPGFVGTYCRREEPLTSGKVLNKLKLITKDFVATGTQPTRDDLEGFSCKFSGLIIKRNALLHAHPITDENGDQILAYQTYPSRPLPDFKWDKQELLRFISEVNQAAVEAGDFLKRLKPNEI